MKLFATFLALTSTYLVLQISLHVFSSRLLWGNDPAFLMRLASNRIHHVRRTHMHPRTSCSLVQRQACAMPREGRRLLLYESTNDGKNRGEISSQHTTPPYPHIDQSECVAAAEWQTTFRTNCNAFHEIHMSHSINQKNGRTDAANNNGVALLGLRSGKWRSARKLQNARTDTNNNEEALSELGSGKWRSAWKLQRMRTDSDDNDETESIVLKTLNYLDRVHFDELTYQRNQLDAAISERVSSQYSVHIYGFCGLSVLNEVADRTLGEKMKELWNEALNKGKKDGVIAAKRQWDLSFLNRLRYARDTARALAYVQSIDAPKRMGRLKKENAYWNITVAHNDLRPTNVVLLGDQVKINDWNAGEKVLFNTTSNSQCLFRRDPPVSPYKSSPERAKRQPISASSDVYALGSILYGLLVGRMPFTGLQKDKAFRNVKAGILPAFPITKKDRKDPAVSTMIRLAKACWSYYPNERPPALEVANELERALKDKEKRESSKRVGVK